MRPLLPARCEGPGLVLGMQQTLSWPGHICMVSQTGGGEEAACFSSPSHFRSLRCLHTAWPRGGALLCALHLEGWRWSRKPVGWGETGSLGAQADSMFRAPCKMTGTCTPEAHEADGLKIETPSVGSFAWGPRTVLSLSLSASSPTKWGLVPFGGRERTLSSWCASPSDVSVVQLA